MYFKKFAIFIGFLLALTPLHNAMAACDICNWRALFQSDSSPEPKPQPKKQLPPAPKTYQYQVVSSSEEVISLQNLNTRKIVHCYNNNFTSAEDCARYFEKYNFVRFRDIPYKTANYDFLHVDTFPTRRWRDSELTSRW